MLYSFGKASGERGRTLYSFGKASGEIFGKASGERRRRKWCCIPSGKPVVKGGGGNGCGVVYLRDGEKGRRPSGTLKRGGGLRES